MFWSIVWSKSDNQNLNSSGAVFCFVHCLIYKVQSLASFSLAWGWTYSIISHSLALVKGFLEFFQLFQLSEFRFLWFLLAFMTNRVSCFCLPFPVGAQRNVVYYITSFSVCQGVLEAFFDFLFREPIPFPNRLGSALPKDQLTSSRRSAQRHLLYHIQLLLSRGFWKIFWRLPSVSATQSQNTMHSQRVLIYDTTNSDFCQPLSGNFFPFFCSLSGGALLIFPLFRCTICVGCF